MYHPIRKPATEQRHNELLWSWESSSGRYEIPSELCESGADGAKPVDRDKPVSWQDSRSWSSQVQDHGSQGSMSVFNRSVRISVCNFVKLCFFSFHQCVAAANRPVDVMKRRARNLRLQTDIPRGTSYSTPGIPHVFCLLKTMSSNYIMRKKIWTITMVETNYVFTICWFMQPCPNWNFGNCFSR